jgi:hypothetical protein
MPQQRLLISELEDALRRGSQPASPVSSVTYGRNARELGPFLVSPH